MTAPPRSTSTSPWTSRTVVVDNLPWHVASRGTDAPILLLHGTGGAVHSWTALAEALPGEVSLIAPDLPGHGATPSPGFARITLPDMARHVATLVAALHVRPVAVVGHSAGAAVMLRLAADGTLSRDTRLVGINPALQPPPAIAAALLRGAAGDVLRSGLARAVVRRVGTLAPVIELLLASTGSRLSPAQEAEYVRAFASPEHAEAAYAMMANWDLAPLLAALPRLPHRTRFIVGARDAWIPPAVAAAAAARLPAATVRTIPGAGHLVHEERAAEVAALLQEFLGER